MVMTAATHWSRRRAVELSMLTGRVVFTECAFTARGTDKFGTSSSRRVRRRSCVGLNTPPMLLLIAAFLAQKDGGACRLE